MKTAVVFAGGDPPPARVKQLLPADAFVIAADSGLDHARLLSVPVALVVGDLDSASQEGLTEAESAQIERHSTDKDASDLTLAMRAAARRGGQRVIVVGGSGGRIDHFLTNCAVLTSDEFSSLQVEWLVGPAVISVVRTEVEILGKPGDMITLLAQGGDATGVTTEGLRWALSGETIRHGSSRGLSNELIADRARVAVRSGVLLVIHLPAWVHEIGTGSVTQ